MRMFKGWKMGNALKAKGLGEFGGKVHGEVISYSIWDWKRL